jgi:hypothetical protein
MCGVKCTGMTGVIRFFRGGESGGRVAIGWILWLLEGNGGEGDGEGVWDNGFGGGEGAE